MSFVLGDYDVKKQRTVVEIATNRKRDVNKVKLRILVTFILQLTFRKVSQVDLLAFLRKAL